jgi:hypothetical protein
MLNTLSLLEAVAVELLAVVLVVSEQERRPLF